MNSLAEDLEMALMTDKNFDKQYQEITQRVK